MIDDYLQMLDNSNGTELERKKCGIIAMDIFTMEALNQIDSSGDFRSYRRAISDPAIYDSVCRFNKNKEYELEGKILRKTYMRSSACYIIISWISSHSW